MPLLVLMQNLAYDIPYLLWKKHEKRVLRNFLGFW